MAMGVIGGVLELAFPHKAHGQTINRTYQDLMARNVGRPTSGNNTTFYDNMGGTTARSTTSGGTTSVYDPMGRQTGTVTTKPQGR